MSKRSTSTNDNQTKTRSKKPDAVHKVAKNKFYNEAGFKNSQIVLGNDTLRKLSVLSRSLFDVELDTKKILKEQTGYILSSLINIIYKHTSNAELPLIEAARTLKAMKLYHYYQAASYLNESLSKDNPFKTVNYNKIRAHMHDCPTLHEILGSTYQLAIHKSWSNEAIDLILDEVWVNEQIIKLNEK